MCNLPKPFVIFLFLLDSYQGFFHSPLRSNTVSTLLVRFRTSFPVQNSYLRETLGNDTLKHQITFAETIGKLPLHNIFFQQQKSDLMNSTLNGHKITEKLKPKRRTKPRNNKRRRPSLINLSVVQFIMRKFSQKAGSVIDGNLPGDIGFDPLGISNSDERLDRLYEIELKHARLAMLGTLGWPSSEIFHNVLMTIFHLPSQLAPGGRAPSIINGGLLVGPNAVGMGIFAVLISALEYYIFTSRKSLRGIKKEYEPGEFGFDPLNLYEFRGISPWDKFRMREGEMYNGRLAMVAMVIFVLTEALTGKPIVDVTPFFFRPFWMVFHWGGSSSAQILVEPLQY